MSRFARLVLACSLALIVVPQSSHASPQRPPTCGNEPGPKATHTWVAYGSFVIGQRTIDLFGDEYTPPPSKPGPYPAAVVAHGGGWVGGCRIWNDDLSARMARDGFIVLNIDYRLACTDQDVDLCGWAYPFPIQDVETAISWMRANAGTFAPFTGKVAAVGTSSGGNLVYMAGDTGILGDTRPDVMAGASGQAELGYMSTGQPSCDSAWPQPKGPHECWVGTAAYMNSSFDFQGPACFDNWAIGSPSCNVNELLPPPPTFIANATRELAAYQAALDFERGLRERSVTVDFCSVAGAKAHDHGTQLLAQHVPCQEHPSMDVYTAMIQFLKANL
jgi:acetyl esterase/lipase